MAIQPFGNFKPWNSHLDTIFEDRPLMGQIRASHRDGEAWKRNGSASLHSYERRKSDSLLDDEI